MADNKPFVITIVGAESSGKTTLAMQLAQELKCVWVSEYAREYLEKLGRDYDEHDLQVIAEEQLERINTAISRESSFVSRQSSAVSESREPSACFAPYPLKGEMKDITEVANDLHDSSLVLGLSSENVIEQLVKNKQRSVVIVDGGLMNLRMWARIKYKMIIPVLEEALKDDVTDLYLLCRPRKEWTPDPLREAPTLLERAWIYNQYLAELMRGKLQMEIITVKEIGSKI